MLFKAEMVMYEDELETENGKAIPLTVQRLGSLSQSDRLCRVMTSSPTQINPRCNTDGKIAQ